LAARPGGRWGCDRWCIEPLPPRLAIELNAALPHGADVARRCDIRSRIAIHGYLRVSTREQGRSGLGLAAQRHEIEVFGAREGFSIRSWHQDVQTGAGDLNYLVSDLKKRGPATQ
jgi:hypothetical protein